MFVIRERLYAHPAGMAYRALEAGLSNVRKQNEILIFFSYHELRPFV